MNPLTATFSVTDLRHRTSAVLKTTNEQGVAYVIRRSRPAVALVAIDYLTALQEAYEDHLDEAEFDATIKLPRIPLVKHKRRATRRA